MKKKIIEIKTLPKNNGSKPKVQAWTLKGTNALA